MKKNKTVPNKRTQNADTVELKVCEKIQGLLNIYYSVILILNEFIIPAFCNTSLSH